jgi:site-specific DNA-methyltransferase (adenine-specific)
LDSVAALALDYPSAEVGRSRIVHTDCSRVARRILEESIHAIVTDPPYSVKEYELE